MTQFLQKNHKLQKSTNRQQYTVTILARPKFTEFGFSLPGIQKQPNTILVQGHQGTSIGKMVAGCSFQSYYPITPASDESVFLESNEILDVQNDRPGSTAVIQTEDEISAIGMMIGASLTGTRSSTSTSGPGLSLMAEAFGWAGMNEVPIVITIYQRSGPSTGLPTRHGQDDFLLLFMQEVLEIFPRLFMHQEISKKVSTIPEDVFNYSDVYQVPVIHMMDKFLSARSCNMQKI